MTNLTTNHPDVVADAFPGTTIKRNPRAVIHNIALAAMLLDVIVGLIFAVVVDKYDSTLEVLVWIVAAAVALATSSAPLQYRVTIPEPADEEQPVSAPKSYAAGGYIQPGDAYPVELIRDDIADSRSFAEPTTYPIPPSIAAALGTQAVAQINKDTKAAGL